MSVYLMPGEYGMYLRKSRADLELEASGGEDVLARHKALLFSVASNLHIPVTRIYEEVVSGDTISARPEVQRLLSDVDHGDLAGVLVVDVDRLARGDTIDQGIVAQSFKYSNTLIITPQKIYDPNNEYDEEYFEFGLFMARREYKMINRRLQRGRIASVNEGKFVGNKSPYGYRRVKLEHTKGYTLEVDPETAPWVVKMFEWRAFPTEYPAGKIHRLGETLIANRLNDLGVPSAKGGKWTSPVVRGILRNPVYIGKIRWNSRASKKTVENGVVKISRPRSKTPIITQGLHPALVDESLFNQVQVLITKPSRPGPKQVELLNPLAGIIVCSACGHNMVRRPYSSGRQETLLCAYNSCHGSVASDLHEVESALLAALRAWLSDFEMNNHTDFPLDTSDLDTAAAALEKELSQIDSQEARAYDLVEQGIYSTDTFVSRSNKLLERRKTIGQKLESIQLERDRIIALQHSRSEIAPKIRHVLDVYSSSTVKEKNDMLKDVLEKVEYKKTTRSRSKNGSDMQLTLYPKLPK